MLRPSKVFLSALLAAVTAFAQNPNAPTAPRPGNAPLTPAPGTQVTPAPGTPAAAAVVPGGGADIPLQFPNTDVKDVLDFYSKLTGRKLIYSNQLVGSIYLSIGPVKREDAVKIIEMSLAMNGFYVVPTEDPELWRVTGVGQNPKTVGVPFIDKEDLLPADDQVVMYLFKLEWQDPTELAQTLSQGVLMPNQAGFTSVVPLPKANALLVTETTSNIRTLIRVVRSIDTEPAKVESVFITLTHAQAEDVVTNLEKLFEKAPTQTTGAPGLPGAPVPGGVRTQPAVQRTVTDGQGNPLPTTGGAPPDGAVSIEMNGGSVGFGPTEDNIIIGKLKLTADKRTNRIHIVTRPVNMPLIRGLIEEYDANVQLPEPFVRPLRHRPVEEVMESIVSAIQDPGDKAGAAGAAGATGAPGVGQRPGAAPQTQGAGAFGNNRLQGGQFGGGTGLDGGGGGGGTLGESLSVQAVETRPLSQQVGKSTIIADQRNNTIIVVGTREVKDKVSLLLDELDVRQAQVMIHTVIGELRLNRNEQFGLEYILRNGGVLTSAGATPTDPTTPTNTSVVGFNESGQAVLDFNNLLSQQNVTRILTGGSSGLSGFIMSGNSFDAVVKAFESNNRFRVVTRPSIYTTNAKRAVITSGEEVPVPTSIQSGFTSGNDLTTNSSIQFKPIELRLEVLPLINSDREVSLEIVQNVSERAGSTIIDNNAIPNISRRALKTYVTVPNNGTLILGGLIKESKDFTRNGILGLSRIPLIGPLFGTTNKDKIRSELIIMMRPVVTYAPSDSARLREKTFEAFAIPPDLESAIMPQGVWDKVPRAKVVVPHRTSAPVLREEISGK